MVRTPVNLAKTLASKLSIVETLVADFKAWATRNPLNGILDVTHDDRKRRRAQVRVLKIVTTRYGQKMQTRFSADDRSSSEWLELESLWHKFTRRSASGPHRVRTQGRQEQG